MDVTVTLDYFTSCILNDLKVLLNFTIIVYLTEYTSGFCAREVMGLPLVYCMVDVIVN